jgi:hypothetical protein|nr:MAG TPA: hypothetical protein [Caudoviricetes sp.]
MANIDRTRVENALTKLISNYLEALQTEEDIDSVNYTTYMMDIYLAFYKSLPVDKLNKLNHVEFVHHYALDNASEKVVRIMRPNPFRLNETIFSVKDVFKGVIDELKESPFNLNVPYIIKIEGLSDKNYSVELCRYEYSTELEKHIILLNERGIAELSDKEEVVEKVQDGATTLNSILSKLVGTKNSVREEPRTPIIPLKDLKEEPKETQEHQATVNTREAEPEEVEKNADVANNEIVADEEIEDKPLTVEEFKSHLVDRILSNYVNIIEHRGTFMRAASLAEARRKFLEGFKDVFVNNTVSIANELEVFAEVLSGRVLINKKLTSSYLSFYDYSANEEFCGPDMEKFIEELIEYDCEEVKTLTVSARVYESDKPFENYVTKEIFKFVNKDGIWECTNCLNL